VNSKIALRPVLCANQRGLQSPRKSGTPRSRRVSYSGNPAENTSNLTATQRAESVHARTRELTVQFIKGQQGSPVELVKLLEENVGWPARHTLVGVLSELRRDKSLPQADQNYLRYTLNAGAINDALSNGAPPNSEHQSSVDELFARSRRYRKSKKFGEAVEFISRFREYSPFNNMLVYALNPLATYFATAAHWRKAFGRTIKEDARPMVILAPHRPVLMVYDIADTEGPPLPQKLRVFTQVSGKLDPAVIERTIRNCERDKIQVERIPMGALSGGYATTRINSSRWKMRIHIRDDLSTEAAYAVLCHELAHIFLGHLGTDADGWWPYRMNLTHAVTEIEAEAVAHIVCRRAGLATRGAEYLSSFVEDNNDLDAISLDLVSRSASRIETMGRRLFPPRRDGVEEPIE
jgi:Zn-dependent protease with chaperone function